MYNDCRQSLVFPYLMLLKGMEYCNAQGEENLPLTYYMYYSSADRAIQHVAEGDSSALSE